MKKYILLLLLVPAIIYAKKIKLIPIKDNSCLNCIAFYDSHVNNGFKLILNKNKKIIYGKFYKDMSLEFDNKFYFFYRIKLSSEDGRHYISLKVIILGTESNLKILFNLGLSPYKLFEKYDDFEGRNMKFLGWISNNTFLLKIGNNTYLVQLSLERHKDIISVFAKSTMIFHASPNPPN
jgi:hypothetical protein